MAAGDSFERTLVEFMNEQPKISDAAKNLLSEHMARSQISGQRFEAPQLLNAVQQALKAIKSVDLQDPVAWGHANPQGEQESGLDRMDAIARYKAAYTLWKQAKAKNQSPAKLLGKSFLVITWSQIRSHIELAQGSENEALVYILNAFEQSFNSTKPETDIIWTSNLYEAIAARQLERQNQASERIKEAERAQEELREAVIEQLES